MTPSIRQDVFKGPDTAQGPHNFNRQAINEGYQFHQPGGPEVMKYEDIDLAAPEKGEVRIRHTAVGLNYIDTYHRSGAYPLPFPSGIGLEAAGVVEAWEKGSPT